jgi:hypothetical protein
VTRTAQRLEIGGIPEPRRVVIMALDVVDIELEFDMPTLGTGVVGLD